MTKSIVTQVFGNGATEWLKNNEEFVSRYIVVSFVAISQGVLALSEVPTNFLFKDNYAMSPSEVAFVSGIISLPWVFKPLYGILSDGFPILGERRKSYIIIFSFFACLNWMLLAFWVRERSLGLIILFNIQFCTAFCNVVGEAMLVEITQMRSKKFNLTEEQQQAEAAQNVSLFFGLKSCGTLTTAYLGGFLMQHMDKHSIFAITGIFPMLLCLSSFFMQGDRAAAAMAGTASAAVESNNSSNNLDQISLFFKFLRKPMIYQPILFILLFMMTPSSSSSMFFFYTNVLGFEPEFMGTLKFIHASGSLLGVLIYNKFLKQIAFKTQFVISTFICVVVGSTQLLLVTRANVELGIPDKLFTLGDTIIIQIVGELNIFPILVLACRLCPRKIEATMYAMIMSTINFGSLISTQLGGAIIYCLGITEENFNNLWILVLIANLSTCLPLVWINLINQGDKDQNKKMTDSDLESVDEQNDRSSSSTDLHTEEQLSASGTSTTTTNDEFQKLVSENTSDTASIKENATYGAIDDDEKRTGIAVL